MQSFTVHYSIHSLEAAVEPDREENDGVDVKMASHIIPNCTAHLFSLTLCSCLFEVKINVEFVELAPILLHQSQREIEINYIFRR